MYQRLADALGVPVVTALVVGWVAAGVVLVAGLLVLLLGGSTVLGLVLFAVGAVASASVAVGLLKARADVPPKGTATDAGTTRGPARRKR